MLVWLVFALMTAAAVGVLLHPLLGSSPAAENTSTASAAVYRDQLAEIEADRQRDLIGVAEAEAASREIARRLIAVSAERAPLPTRMSVTSRTSVRALALAVGVLLPVLAVALYLPTGAPGLPSAPATTRLAKSPVDPQMVKLISAVEERLRQAPEDGRGWDVIAPVYLRLDRFGDAATAFRNAIRLLGENPRRLAGLAEALMLGADARVDEEARAALRRLLALEPDNLQARFWLALAKEQDGKTEDAAADYDKLLADTPPEAPWRAMLQERREAVRSAASGAPAATSAPTSQPGPSEADVAAASRMSPDDRRSMIEGMVSGLSARLEKNGRDVEGWQRLIRALAVLGRKEEAAAALTRARKTLADEPQALATLADLARSLGLGT